MSAVTSSPARADAPIRTIHLVTPEPEVVAETPSAPTTGPPLRVAMIGQRGVPASWGGVEHHVEALGSLLADREVRVTVYARRGYARQLRHYKGMRVRTVPTVGTKHLEATVHSLLSTILASLSSADVIHYHALGPGMWSWIPRLFTDKRVVQTVHGLDNRRDKWGGFASRMLSLCAWLSVHVPHATITVASDLRDELVKPIRRVTHIPNGVRRLEPRPPGPLLERLGLAGRDYLLYVGRFVPEKRADLLLDAFRALEDHPDLRLVLAGASSFTDAYAAQLQELAVRDERVVLPGYVFGAELEELYSNARLFVQPSDLEGLPLTLLEATALGVPTIASDIAPHVEVLAGDGPGHRLFAQGDGADLARVLREALHDDLADRAGAAALSARVRQAYSWDAAADMTLSLYREPVSAGVPAGRT